MKLEKHISRAKRKLIAIPQTKGIARDQTIVLNVF